MLPGPFHCWQRGLVTCQGPFERVAQVDEKVVAISDLLGARRTAFGSLSVAPCLVPADQLHPAMSA